MRVVGRLISVLMIALTCSEVQATEPPPGSSSVPGGIISALLQDHETPFLLYPYETNYLLYTYTSRINTGAISSYDWSNGALKDEVKFQLSLAFPVWRGIAGENSLLGASYTQRSWWQMSNASESAPFRETNYEPQLFLGWSTDIPIGGWTLSEAEIGLNHQSNGKAEPTSRSWDRAYVRLMARQGNWLVDLKPWIRFSESNSKDDNPDITKYMGYYRLKVGYALGDATFSMESHYNWNSGYGGAELGGSYPLTSHVRLYTQIFSGYGESMIDYNFKQTRAGVGIMLNDIL